MELTAEKENGCDVSCLLIETRIPTAVGQSQLLCCITGPAFVSDFGMIDSVLIIVILLEIGRNIAAIFGSCFD